MAGYLSYLLKMIVAFALAVLGLSDGTSKSEKSEKQSQSSNSVIFFQSDVEQSITDVDYTIEYNNQSATVTRAKWASTGCSSKEMPAIRSSMPIFVEPDVNRPVGEAT